MSEPEPKPRTGWIGPLFRWELIRLARRGQAVRARSLLAVVVLLSLMFFTVFWFANQGIAAVFLGTAKELSIQESANFGDRFATTFLISQLFVMIFLTPAYAAGGIAEEKERKTFDFLIVSSLSSREIVIGKYLGRVVFLFGVLIAGLPILSLTLLYGGVDLGLVLATYLLTAGTVAVISAASMYAALSADSYRSAMFRAYGLTVLYALIGFGCFYISPLFIFVMLQNLREDTVPFILLALGYPLVELAIVIFLLNLAIRRIRTIAAASSPEYVRNSATTKAKSAPIIAKPVVTTGLQKPILLDEPSPPHETPDSLTVSPDSIPEKIDSLPHYPESIAKKPESIAQESVNNVTNPLPIARPIANPIANPVTRPVAKVIERKQSERATDNIFPDASKRHPPVNDEDPFYWKEMYCTLHNRTSDEDSLTGLKISAAIMIAFVFAIVGLIGFGSAAAGRGGEILFCTATFGVLLHMIVIGSDACGRIALERSRSTLETLLSLPTARNEMIFAKWRVSAIRGCWWGVPCAIIGPLCIMGSPLGIIGLPILVYQLMLISLSAIIGLYLSMRCQSTAKAMMFYLVIIGSLVIAPAIVYFGFAQPNLYAHIIAWGLMLAAIACTSILWYRLNREFEQDGGGFDGAR